MPPEIYPKLPRSIIPRGGEWASPTHRPKQGSQSKNMEFPTIGILRLFYDTVFRQREKGYLHKISEKTTIFPCS
jgi:hypothetical protein